MKPKATKEYANYLVSAYFQLIDKKDSNYIIGSFEGYEYIAKGQSIIQIIHTPSLNKFQKNELIKIIKEL